MNVLRVGHNGEIRIRVIRQGRGDYAVALNRVDSTPVAIVWTTPRKESALTVWEFLRKVKPILLGEMIDERRREIEAE